MDKLKTVDIKGKAYVEVNERLKYFRANYPYFSLTTDIIELTNDRVVLKAIIKDEIGHELANGLAYEMANGSFINKTSYIENCETSAWGRALGNFGIGIDASVASADEIMNAISNQTITKEQAQDYEFKTRAGMVKGKDMKKENLEWYANTKTKQAEYAKVLLAD